MDQIEYLTSKNNELREELSCAQLKCETFQTQIEEYQRENQKLNNRLKEKDNTIKNLIASAEEKDNLIIKLRVFSAELASLENSIDADKDQLPIDKEQIKKVKISGLLKLIEEKNQQIETLQSELAELKSKAHSATMMDSSTSDLSSSFTNSMQTNNGKNNSSSPPLSPSLAVQHLPVTTSTSNEANSMANYGKIQKQSVRILLESLEKEIRIYKGLNSTTVDKEE
jgi:chromosome segregation ATPase